jgi:hypothetical protein
MTVLACSAGFAAGCGGDDGSGGPLESSLAFVPEGTPFVVALDTDLEGDQYDAVQAILDRFPGDIDLQRLLAGQVEGGGEGISFEKDVKPLLGNPFVVSAADVTSFVGDSEADNDFVAAVEVKDTDALDRLIEKTDPAKQGESGGATLYGDEGTSFAVDDEMVVFAGSRELLEAALERADGGDHFDAGDFEDSLADLPEEPLARIYFDVQRLIAQDPDTKAARRVEWVDALSTLGMTASVEKDEVDVEFNLRADGKDLDDEDLPLAAGDESPEIVQRRGELGFGVRDPSQIVSFVESALQAVEPGTFGDYETGKQAISQRLGVDVDRDLFEQLTGDMSVSLAVDGSFGARAEVGEPAAFRRTVDKVAGALPDLGSGLGVTGTRRAGELYEARLAEGGRFFFGVSNDVFVVASTPARALELARQKPAAVDGADGSFVMAADAQRLVREVVAQLRSQLGATGQLGAGLFAGQLDDLSGSVSSSADGMRGSFSLTLD